jgi:hypothetical protein
MRGGAMKKTVVVVAIALAAALAAYWGSGPNAYWGS